MTTTKLEPGALLPATQRPQQIQPSGAFSSIQNFEDAQRMAKVLCASSIVPQSYRENIADCVIALEMSNRIGANPLAVMQNLYIVHGRPAWSSQFLISCVNASGKFSPLRYRETGEKGQDSWGCIAWAQDRGGERLESPEVTIGMAKAEGWVAKNGSKWKTMPQLMLRYRAATLFARLFAPELTMGIQCDDEVIDVFPVVTEAAPKQLKPVFEPAKADEVPMQFPPQPAPAASPALAPEPPSTTSATEPPTPQAELQRLLAEECAVSFDDFRSFVGTKRIALDSDSWASWSDVPTVVVEALQAQPKTTAELIRKFGKVGGK